MKKTVLAVLIAASALPAIPAAADPPRWAPAHGYRGHHGHDRFDDDRRYYRTDNGIRYWRGDNGRYYCRRSDGTVGLLIGGVACDRFSPNRVLAVAALFVAVFGLIYGAGLGSGVFWLAVATLCIGMFGHGLANCPLGGFMATLFPVRFRYTGVALSFNVGAVIGGALMPIAAQAMTVAGFGPWTGILLVGAGMATLVGIALARPADPQA